MVSLAGIIH